MSKPNFYRWATGAYLDDFYDSECDWGIRCIWAPLYELGYDRVNGMIKGQAKKLEEAYDMGVEAGKAAVVAGFCNNPKEDK